MMLGDPGLLLGDCPPERSTYVGLPRLTAMQLRSGASHGVATDAVALDTCTGNLPVDYMNLIELATRPDLEGREKGKII